MTPWVLRLLIANVVVFFFEQTMPAIKFEFAFVPALALARPWTIITYMFLHSNLMHIAFNMIALYFFGPRVEARLGERRFVTLYFVSGIAGAILSFFFAFASPIIGASGAIFGVTLAFAYYWPNDLIYIWGILPIPAKWLVVIYTLISLFSGLGGSLGGVADFAHLGGFVGAFVYLKWIERTGIRRRQAFQRAGAPRVDDTKLVNWRRVDPRNVHEVNREEVNRILDKISAKGLASLTPQERQFLASFVPPDDRVPPPS